MMQANELKKTEIWEKMGSDEVRRLLNQNKDACQEEIRFLDSQGFIVARPSGRGVGPLCIGEAALDEARTSLLDDTREPRDVDQVNAVSNHVHCEPINGIGVGRSIPLPKRCAVAPLRDLSSPDRNVAP